MNDRESADAQYAALLGDVLSRGEAVQTRNACCRRLTVPPPARFRRFPLVAARRTAWKSALREMEWFLSGSNDLADLHPSVRPWWAPWADPAGRIPHNYARMFRHFHGAAGVVDQVALLRDGLRRHPFSRRHVLTTWNAADMAAAETPITNCHGTVVQCFVGQGNRLSLVTYQRSADVLCGLPHNWAQYWALLVWLAALSGRGVGEMVWVGGDVHVYECHGPLARRVVEAAPLCGETPDLLWESSGEDFRADNFRLDGPYRPVLGERAALVV